MVHGKIFEPFFKNVNRWPNPIHTVVGVPYGHGSNKSSFHKNALYRIRTTRDYYSEREVKKKYYPNELIEIELWPDIFEFCKDKLEKWFKDNGINFKVKDDFHLDENKNEKIKLISIDKILINDTVEAFNEILREGFLKAEKK